MTLPRSAPVPGWGGPISRRAWRHRLTVAFGCRSADDIGRSAGRTGQPDLPCGAYRLWHPYGPPNPTNPALWHLISAGTSTSTRFEVVGRMPTNGSCARHHARWTRVQEHVRRLQDRFFVFIRILMTYGVLSP